jgi:hypothetical protein
MVSEEVLVNCYNFNPFTSVKKDHFKVKLSGARAGAGIEIRICVSAEPKEILSAPQHC